jgi:YHS domain-containing protein
MNDKMDKKEPEEKTARPNFIALCGRAFHSDPDFFPQVEFKGRTIYLCTSVCLDAFLADPDRFYISHRKKYIKKDGE